MINAFTSLSEVRLALPAEEYTAAFAAFVVGVSLLLLVSQTLRAGLQSLLLHRLFMLQVFPLLAGVVGVGLAAAEALPTAADVAAQLHGLLGLPLVEEELTVLAADVLVGALLHEESHPRVAESLELFLRQQSLHIVHVDGTRARLLGALQQHCAGTVAEGANVLGKAQPAKGAFAVDHFVGAFHQIPAEGTAALALVGQFVDFVFYQIQGLHVSRNFYHSELEYNFVTETFLAFATFDMFLKDFFDFVKVFSSIRHLLTIILVLFYPIYYLLSNFAYYGILAIDL